MAKPYRRRKNGKLVGNFRVTLPSGRDLNLKTKDAREALARAALAVKGKWPPEEAAVAAALETLDPGASPEAGAGDPAGTDQDPAPPAAAEGAAGAPAGEPQRSTAPAGAPEPTRTLDDAAAAAAAGADGGAERVEAEQVERENAATDELQSLMAELTKGAGGADLLDAAADMAAAAILWAERKSIELGWQATMLKRTRRRLETVQPPPESIMRKTLRIGLKVTALQRWPGFMDKLTPGWAIAIGMLGGGAQAIAAGQLVAVDSGEVTPIGDAAREAYAAATAPPRAPGVS